MCSIFMISNAQPPNDHPAMQMRKYYCDVYTSNSIFCFESFDLDSILVVARTFIEPAQVISLYSYKQNPYNHENPFLYPSALAENRSSYTAHSLPCFGKNDRKKIADYWRPRQYNRDFSRTISGRYSYWRPRDY